MNILDDPKLTAYALGRTLPARKRRKWKPRWPPPRKRRSSLGKSDSFPAICARNTRRNAKSCRSSRPPPLPSRQRTNRGASAVVWPSPRRLHCAPASARSRSGRCDRGGGGVATLQYARPERTSCCPINRGRKMRWSMRWKARPSSRKPNRWRRRPRPPKFRRSLPRVRAISLSPRARKSSPWRRAAESIRARRFFPRSHLGFQHRALRAHRGQLVPGRGEQSALDLFNRCRHRLLRQREAIHRERFASAEGCGADRRDDQLF